LTEELNGLLPNARQKGAVPKVRATIEEWLTDSDLSCVRDDTEIRKLPEAEQAGWRNLWGEMKKLQAKLEAGGSAAARTAAAPLLPRELGPAPRVVRPQ
jgi:hypothetical protein